MACPRVLLQSVNLCSRVCRATAWTARPNLRHVVRPNILPAPVLQREFSCSTAALKKEGRLFSKEHEWILPEGDAQTGTIGISEYAQEQLGDIVYIELPSVGSTMAKGDAFGVVESVKAASDLYALIDGEVSEVNSALEQTPELVNSDPLVAGWMLKMTIDKPEQLDDLMTEDEYQEFLESSPEK